MKKTGTGQIGNSQIPVPFMFVGEEMTFILLWASPFCPPILLKAPRRTQDEDQIGIKWDVSPFSPFFSQGVIRANALAQVEMGVGELALGWVLDSHHGHHLLGRRLCCNSS